MRTRCFFAQLGLLLLAATPPLSVAAEPNIGYLFTSPKERVGLDNARQKSGKNRIELNAPVEDQIGDQITVDGFVRKNDGKTTVWVNQVPQYNLDNSQTIAVHQSSRRTSTVTMQLPSGNRVRLKAGQTFDATNGKITDVYDDATAKEPAK